MRCETVTDCAVFALARLWCGCHVFSRVCDDPTLSSSFTVGRGKREHQHGLQPRYSSRGLDLLNSILRLRSTTSDIPLLAPGSPAAFSSSGAIGTSGGPADMESKPEVSTSSCVAVTVRADSCSSSALALLPECKDARFLPLKFMEASLARQLQAPLSIRGLPFLSERTSMLVEAMLIDATGAVGIGVLPNRVHKFVQAECA